MSSGPHLQEFENLQDVYRHTCEAFEHGEITSTHARNIVTSLRHTDAAGVVWKIDTQRSGRRATFMRADKQAIAPTETPRSTPTSFEAMDRRYRNICAAFERGELTASSARQEVTSLRFADSEGRAWKIDTQRSGKKAAFVLDPDSFVPRPIRRAEPVREHHVKTESSSDAYTEEDDFDDDEFNDYAPQLRFKELTVAAFTILVGLGILLATTGSGSPSTTSTSAPTGSTPLPTIPTNPAVTYSQLASFENRSAIPNNSEIEFGRSLLNRPLTVIRRGNPNGVRVLVVGCIHGTECAGLAITDILKTMPLPQEIDLWILPKLNPDGLALNTRQNANKVDLNRNFPINWKPLGKLGDWQWSGNGPATEPEVLSMMTLGKVIQPQLTIWYHQDYFRISPGSGRDGQIRKRYAGLVDLPILPIEGGSYSGTASMWSETMNKNDSTSLTVEFGKTLRTGEAQANANAITTIIAEFFPS